jgi:hypothetical protein
MKAVVVALMQCNDFYDLMFLFFIYLFFFFLDSCGYPMLGHTVEIPLCLSCVYSLLSETI